MKALTTEMSYLTSAALAPAASPRPYAISVDAQGSSFSVGGVQAHSQRSG